MEFIHLFTLFMTILLSSTASGNHMFVQTGDSVKLEITNKTLPHFSRFVWKNDKSENVVRFLNQSGELIPHSLYKDRVDFNTKTFSLTLKNMQKTDSGIYTARTIGQKETIVAEHSVSVIDPVDSPVLNWNATMSVNSCIVNVSCSGHVLTLSTSYLSNNCSQVEETSSEMQTLALRCIENIVVCNYSNSVSWKNDTIEIKQLCSLHEHTSPTENPKESNGAFPLHWLLIVAVVTLLVFAAVSVTRCSYKKHKKGVQVENDHTVYAQVQLKKKEQRPLEMLEESANPQTVYGFEGGHKQTHNTGQNRPCPKIRTHVQNQPSTTYSTIGQHQKTSFPTETEHTVYSRVCKSS